MKYNKPDSQVNMKELRYIVSKIDKYDEQAILYLMDNIDRTNFTSYDILTYVPEQYRTKTLWKRVFQDFDNRYLIDKFEFNVYDVIDNKFKDDAELRLLAINNGLYHGEVSNKELVYLIKNGRKNIATGYIKNNKLTESQIGDILKYIIKVDSNFVYEYLHLYVDSYDLTLQYIDNLDEYINYLIKYDAENVLSDSKRLLLFQLIAKQRGVQYLIDNVLSQLDYKMAVEYMNYLCEPYYRIVKDTLYTLEFVTAVFEKVKEHRANKATRKDVLKKIKAFRNTNKF